MANLAGGYDENAEPSGDFSPIPNNNYRAKIIESEIVDISSRENRGRCLKLTWQIETGAYDGRLVWQRLNMWPENMANTDKVVQIANAQFASIRAATGKPAPQDSSELHHIPCEIYVGLSKAKEGYNQQNEVKSVKAISGAASAPQQRQAPQQSVQMSTPPQQAASGGGQRSAPWPRRA
jgi:hypothetical protein